MLRVLFKKFLMLKNDISYVHVSHVHVSGQIARCTNQAGIIHRQVGW